MNNIGWAAVVVGIVILVGGWWWYSTQGVAPVADTQIGDTGDTQIEGSQMPNTGLVGDDAEGGGQGAVVRYTASGFVPASIVVRPGESVSFVNETSGRMWVASDEHPTHTEYGNTDRATHCADTYAGPAPFDQCEAGQSYTFIFTKPGTFEYHNHAAAQFGGTVTVQ